VFRPWRNDQLPADVVAAIEATGLLPSRTHELVRNVMVSSLTGLDGGFVDRRPVATELDERLRADRILARLPGRFLFVLDDGRGDRVGRSTAASTSPRTVG
jgi:precorrin-3B synthase